MKKFTASQDDATIEIQLGDSAQEFGGFDLRALLSKIERVVLNAYYERFKSRNKAASLLGLKRTTLLEKMRRHGFPLSQRNKNANSGV